MYCIHVCSPDLQDLERLETLVKMAANSMALSVADGGHKYAISASSSPIAPTSMLAEMFDGMQQVRNYVWMHECGYVLYSLYIHRGSTLQP